MKGENGWNDFKNEVLSESFEEHIPVDFFFKFPKNIPLDTSRYCKLKKRSFLFDITNGSKQN